MDINKIEDSKQTKKEFKYYLKKFWFLIWKDDSPKGWAASVIFAFVFIKFIFFPVLSFATGTTLPLAIVESCSMYHQGNFFSDTENWWQAKETNYAQFDITQSEFSVFSFTKGFNKGDILFIVGTKPENLDVGDVIIFETGRQNPLIHRIVKIRETNEGRIFSTMGDNNNGQLTEEKEISEEQIVGKAVFRLAPYAGWAKLIFFEGKQPDYNKGFCD